MEPSTAAAAVAVGSEKRKMDDSEIAEETPVTGDDLNLSMESDHLDPELKAASEADTLPMDGKANLPESVQQTR
jgi:hypothetical protein